MRILFSVLTILYLLSPICLKAQNSDELSAIEILSESYKKISSQESYSATYRISYTSDLDTGETTVGEIDIVHFLSSTKIENEDFLSLQSDGASLSFDHVNDVAVYMPSKEKENNQLNVADVLSFYIPTTRDSVSIETRQHAYYISVIPKLPGIERIEYVINKNNFHCKSITLLGQVHPVLRQDLNAKMIVELLSFKSKTPKQDILDTLSLSYYLSKKENVYVLEKFTNYQLQVFEY
jgi:hypothetical protein